MARRWPLLFLFLAAIDFNKADSALLAILILGDSTADIGTNNFLPAVRQEPIFLTLALIFLSLDPLEGSVMDLTVLIFLVSIILAQAKFILKSIVLVTKQDKMFQTEHFLHNACIRTNEIASGIIPKG